MPADTEWKQEEKAQLFYPSQKDLQDEEKEEDGKKNQVVLKNLPSLRITLKDGQEKTLCDADFQDIKEDAQILLEDSLLYMTYTSASGESVNTLESQKAQLEKIAEAEAKEEAERQAAEQAAAQASQQYQEPVYEKPVYEEPVYEQPVCQEPSVPDQSPDVEDQSGQDCMTGGIVIRP